MPEVNSRNFFVGPKTISQRDRFFGRETEITRLTHRLLAERIVLMYSPSGAGKSSLIAAGVLDEFTRVTNAEFHILPTVRLHLTTNGAGHAASPFSQAAVRCLLGSQEAPDGSLPFDSIASLVGYSKEAAAKARGNTEVCLLLVFDQFEECLTLLPDRLDAAAALFDDLSRVLDDENVWALFAIREDLLAPILDLGRRLPTRFRHTFRLDFLRGEDAKVVVEKTLALGGYTLEKNALKELVDDLTLVNVQDQHGNFRWRPGEYVEPLHLQVVWTYILNQLPPGKNLISRQELKRSMAEGIASVSTPGAGLVASVFGGNGECTAPISRVDDALAAYYAGELSRICRGNIEQERDLRFWIEEKLIDAKRTRIPVRQGTEQTDGLENASVEMLYEAYIVRKERRLNAFWYELAHDRLVQPILLDNAKWFEAKLGPVAQRYRRWKQTGKLDRYLLTRRELRTARRQEAIIGHASPGEQEFIQKSRESARRAIVRFWMAIVIPLLFGTGVTAFLAKSKLDAQRLSHLRQFSALRPL
ncbi:MAG: ATP-binding protein, partial [Verrucomicrobia bacterium]|nr:ATP-binding protein [Verrucomicrobiota bacterium]